MTGSSGQVQRECDKGANSHSPDGKSPRRIVRRNDGGFTLISQLFAMSMMSVLVMALVGMAGIASGVNISSMQRTSATTLLQDKIEEARRAGYNYAISSNKTVTEAYGSIAAYPAYKRITVTRVNNPSTAMQKVTVTVYWNQDRKKIAMSTIVAP